jgi:hypothetical protein
MRSGVPRLPGLGACGSPDSGLNPRPRLWFPPGRRAVTNISSNWVFDLCADANHGEDSGQADEIGD